MKRIPYNKLNEHEQTMFQGLGPLKYELGNGIQITKTRPNDPAYQLISNDPAKHSKKQAGVLHKDNCYICRDNEFAQMGMPLCYACPQCKANPNINHSGHIPADDCECTECGYEIEY